VPYSSPSQAGRGAISAVINNSAQRATGHNIPIHASAAPARSGVRQPADFIAAIDHVTQAEGRSKPVTFKNELTGYDSIDML
jgi:hypothetical protein